MGRVAVVVPCFNEAPRVLNVLISINNYISKEDIFVIDDGSTDDTIRVAKDFGCRIFELGYQRGKAATLVLGMDVVFNEGYSVVLCIDGDGQHDPNKIPVFLESLKYSDIVFGSRSLNDPLMPFVRRIGNFIITKTLGVLFDIWVDDALSGYKGITKEGYYSLKLDGTEGYFIESDIAINTSRMNLRWSEVCVPTIYNSDKFHGTTKLDGALIELHILWRKVFG